MLDELFELELDDEELDEELLLELEEELLELELEEELLDEELLLELDDEELDELLLDDELLLELDEELLELDDEELLELELEEELLDDELLLELDDEELDEELLLELDEELLELDDEELLELELEEELLDDELLLELDDEELDEEKLLYPSSARPTRSAPAYVQAASWVIPAPNTPPASSRRNARRFSSWPTSEPKARFVVESCMLRSSQLLALRKVTGSLVQRQKTGDRLHYGNPCRLRWSTSVIARKMLPLRETRASGSSGRPSVTAAGRHPLRGPR